MNSNLLLYRSFYFTGLFLFFIKPNSTIDRVATIDEMNNDRHAIPKPIPIFSLIAKPIIIIIKLRIDTANGRIIFRFVKDTDIKIINKADNIVIPINFRLSSNRFDSSCRFRHLYYDKKM